MVKADYKNSLEFLKHIYLTGTPGQRRGALNELRDRWTEVSRDWQTKLNIFGIMPYQIKHG